MRPFKVALIETTPPATTVPAWVHRELAAEDIDFVVHGCTCAEDLAAHAQDADLVWVWGSRVITAERLGLLSRCGAILRSGSGTDNVPVAEATRRHVLVMNTPAAMAEEVSNHTVALLLSLVRQVVAQDRAMRAGAWEERRENNRWHLNGSTLGVIGFGHIGQMVARKMAGFGVRLLVHDPYVSQDPINALRGKRADLLTVASQSDFLAVHCPLTDATRHLIGEAEMAVMKPHAILVNASRGEIIDEAALIRALRENRIGGAALDVFEREPLAADSPLLQFGNVVTTPHIGAYSDNFPESFWRYSVETLLAVANGYWPRSVVNPWVQPIWPLLRREWPLDGLSYTRTQGGKAGALLEVGD